MSAIVQPQSNIDVSIIIVSWNTREILCKCLEALCNHARNMSCEIILVDNGSSDGSPEAVEKEFPQVKLIRNKKNLGFAKANNIGIRASVGRYLCLINSDVFVLDNCIDALINFMDENPSVGIAGPRICNPDGSLQTSCRSYPSIWNTFCQAVGLSKLFPKSAFFSEAFMKYWAHDTRRQVDVLSGCFWIVRREAVETVGLLDEKFFIYGEDIDWCRRFREAGWDVVFYPGAEAIHIHRASSSNDPLRFYIEMQKADMHYWRKHHGVLSRFAYICIILLRHVLRILLYAASHIFCPTQRKELTLKMRKSFAYVLWLFCSREHRR